MILHLALLLSLAAAGEVKAVSTETQIPLLSAQHHYGHLPHEQRTYRPAQAYSGQVHADREGDSQAVTHSTQV